MKVISKQEAIKQGSIRYYTGKACKFEHDSERLVSTKRCIECERLRSATRRKSDPLFVEANKKHSQRFNEENKEHLKRIKRERYASDEDFRKLESIRQKTYYRTQKGKQSKIISRNKYRALKINAQAACVNRLMTEEFYVNCPEGYEVDHIIPLSKGGNHDVSNLQYLTKTLNISKKDRHYTEISLPIFCIPCNPVL